MNRKQRWMSHAKTASVRRVVSVAAAGLLAVTASLAHAAVTIECTVVIGPELKRQSGRLAIIDATHVQIASADGRQGMDVPLADVVWIDLNNGSNRVNPPPPSAGVPAAPTGRPSRRGPAQAVPPQVPQPNVDDVPVQQQAAPSGDFLVVLRDGQRLRGTPGTIGNDALTLHTRWFGDRAVPVARIAGLARLAGSTDFDSIANALIGSGAAPSTQPAAAAAAQDELRLSNGDVVRGVVASGDERAVTVQSADGGTVPVEWANVRQVKLALLPGTEASDDASQPAAFIVRTSGGDLVRCSDAKLGQDARLVVKLVGGGDGSIASGELQSIDHLNGNVRLLSGIAPASRTYLPYFPSADGSTGALPAPPPTITISGQTTRAFLMTRPKSRITWKLDDPAIAGAKRLRTRYGIPDARRYANATVRILLDERVVHEQTGVASGTLSDPVELDLAGAHTLSFEVDYGESFDVQDDVVWFEPVLVMNPQG